MWSRKLPRFMRGNIGPGMELCKTLGLLIPMVLRLHQTNGYMKRKLQVWRAQKCIALVGARTILTCAGPQTTPFYGGQYRAVNGTMRNFGRTNPDGTVFALKQWLYQNEATGMESSKLYCRSRCKNSTYQCWVANYPISCMAV